MNWLEIGQKVEGLIDYLEEGVASEKEYPKTLAKLIKLAEDMVNYIDNPID